MISLLNAIYTVSVPLRVFTLNVQIVLPTGMGLKKPAELVWRKTRSPEGTAALLPCHWTQECRGRPQHPHSPLPPPHGSRGDQWALGGHRLSSTVVAPLSTSQLPWPNETPVLFPGTALTNHTGIISLTTIQLPAEQSSHLLLHFYQHVEKKLLSFFLAIAQHTYLWEPVGVHLTQKVFTQPKGLCPLKIHMQLQVEDCRCGPPRGSFLQAPQL